MRLLTFQIALCAAQAAGGRGEHRDAGVRPAAAAVARQGDAHAGVAGEAPAASRCGGQSGAERVRGSSDPGSRQLVDICTGCQSMCKLCIEPRAMLHGG